MIAGTAPTWLGTIPTWIILAMALLVAWRVTRGGGGAAVSELSKANEVLTIRVHELGSEVRDLRVENAELRGRTDFVLALEPILKWSVSHESRAQERHEGVMELNKKQLTLLGMIADQMPKEPNGH